MRSEPAIYVQECDVLFAANFIRWATHWLSSQPEPAPNNMDMSSPLDLSRMGVKRQVQVGAHVSAQIVRSSQGKLLRFSQHSVFAGKVLKCPGCDGVRPFG